MISIVTESMHIITIVTLFGKDFAKTAKPIQPQTTVAVA